MLWILFLISIFINGFILLRRFFSFQNKLFILGAVFVLGSVSSVSVVLIIASIIKDLNIALILYGVFTTVFYATNRSVLNAISFKKITLKKYCILASCFLFSWYIFNKSFSYDSANGQFLIASQSYIDFSARISFIRSFSFGANFPMEVPFFANKGLLYHMVFDAYAGILEFLGLRIDYALNLVSSLSFTFLLICIFALSLIFFKSKLVALISVILFVFVSDLSFSSFLKENTPTTFISSFWHNVAYRVASPLGDNTVSTFWNLNIFLTQRHLVFGLLFAVFFLVILIQKKKIERKTAILLGVLLGIFPFWHILIFFCLCILIVGFFIIDKEKRYTLLIILFLACFIALPYVFFIKIHSINTIAFNPGFLTAGILSIKNFLIFWLWNLGISFFLILAGFLLSNNHQRKLFLVFFILFIVPNLLQFGREVSENHKFFNLWIIVANMFTAYIIVRLLKKGILAKTLSLPLLFFAMFSGVLNIMVIKNDVYTTIPDYTHNVFLTWSKNNIPRNAIMITNGSIYDPMSIIGKKIFLGNTRYIYQYGGEISERVAEKQALLHSNNVSVVTQIAKKNNIAYIVLYKNEFAKNEEKIDESFFSKNFRKLYGDTNGSVFKLE